MHLSEGVLSLPVIVTGAAGAAIGLWQGLRRTSGEDVPRLAMMAAVFFLASFIHFPIGVSSIHLILSGLTGIFLGWGAFPAIFTGLLLQAVLFQFGGLTTLGVNAVAMAGPAVLCSFLFAPLLRRGGKHAFWGAFFAGACSIALAATLMALALALSGKQFLPAAKLLLFGNSPLMAVEGLITASIYSFVLKVKPEIIPSTQFTVERENIRCTPEN